MLVVGLLINLTLLLSIDCYLVDPGPLVIATKGEVWPKPQHQDTDDSYFVIRPQIFEFKVIKHTCTILQDAFTRYHQILLDHYQTGREFISRKDHLHHKKQWLDDANFLGYLDVLNVSLSESCTDNEYPTLGVFEEYELLLGNGSVQLSASTIWGVLRGLETFSQLIYLGDDTLALRVNSTIIYDYPRFSHRGLLLDTSRHFIPLDTIFTMLDAMSYNKLNVFHWHITDDQSFPFVSKKFPELSAKGAYVNSLVYSPSDVQEVIEYARIRGIRVLAEFDTPGHTRSWGEAEREILTECYNGTEKTGKLGPINPARNETYDFLKEFFEEVRDVFPEQYIHLGGDEVEFECWQSNPSIKDFMEKNNMSDHFALLESYYIQKLINIVNQLNSSSIVWEEVFTNGVILPNETIVHVWKSFWETTLGVVTASGRTALLSSCWYLDHLNSGGDWTDFYYCEPYDFLGTEDQKKLILGGEACMWSEVVNQYNVVSRVWPRASATAERLWSNQTVNDINEAARRLEEHTCRMNRRGIGAEPPNAAGYCI